MSWTDIAEYESIRVTHAAHSLRHSHHPNMIQSGPDRTLMLSSRDGYMCFRIVESGLEIPLANVASAIPKAVPLASKLQKTTGSRLTPKPQQAPKTKPQKNVPRKVRGHDGEMVIPKRRPGQTKSIVSPVPGVSDGED